MWLWTQNLTHDPPHASRTPDTARLAAGDTIRAGLVRRARILPPRRTGCRSPTLRHRGPEPAAYLQVDTAVYAGRAGGAGQ